MAKVRVSLANKCQLMFGLAVVVILTAALAVPWLRMQKLVDEAQQQIARRLADAWVHRLIEVGGTIVEPDEPVGEADPEGYTRFRLIDRDDFARSTARDPFLDEAIRQFDQVAVPEDMSTRDAFVVVVQSDGQRRYRYVRAVRQSDLDRARGGFAAELSASQVTDAVRAVLVIDMFTPAVSRQILLNRVYILIAGLLAGLLAIVVFWYITTRVILSPIRVLRSTAEKVSEGDLNTRADINTGDEFEQLSDTFNAMLVNLRSGQAQMQSLNKQLDLKLNELAQTNVSLFEANRLKNDFLANVSHELRTPLNSIVGFAELLAEAIKENKPLDEKRRRYVQNIISSSRALLDLINELLDLAKIEAGRIELHVEPTILPDVCEDLANLVRPQAEAREQNLEMVVDEDVPVIRTDAPKVQQVLFNLLSNALKFTPAGGTITLGLHARYDEQQAIAGARISVADTGPGIAPENHEDIFQKFRQIDESHTRSHTGTGLGLAISRELARILGGEIELDSELGRGATFCLVLPLSLEARTHALMPDLTG
jgi:signal transduction histidine kinase